MGKVKAAIRSCQSRCVPTEGGTGVERSYGAGAQRAWTRHELTFA
jgi:hypothetical protein